MIDIGTFFSTFEFKSGYFFSFFIGIFNWSEFDVSVSIICYCRNHNTIFVFKHEAEFVSFKLTAFQAFSEVEFHFNWYVVYTFFSWFAWFFNFLSCWVVVVDYLSRSVFDIYTTRYISFHCCWDVELVVTSKGELSCIDNLCVVCVAK